MRKYTPYIILLYILNIGGKISAEEITLQILSYNADTEKFEIATSGQRPKGSIVTFENEYGETTGNRYNQIPRNRQANLYLEGWKGCTINKITLSMCSNNKAGTIGLIIKDGEDEIYKKNPVDFASEDWFGQWVSKDLGVMVDITKEFDLPTITQDLCTICLKAGTSEGSVYIGAITIDYTPNSDVETESPLGWIFEKLEKKSTISVGDIVMLYRSGNAAADYDGMEVSKYLDVVGISSTTNMTDPDVLLFTLGKDESAAHWTLTDQWGRTLGATGKQSLVWDDGNMGWDITLGYDGATISNANSNYGTIRFNAPSGSYARFWNYTSTSLALPYLYRRTRQIEPTIATSLEVEASEITVDLAQEYLVIKPTIKPATTTDKRIIWTSEDENIAKVNGGYVNLISEGEVELTATTADGGATQKIKLIITNTTNIKDKVEANHQNKISKYLNYNKIIIRNKKNSYLVNGQQI